MLKCVFIIYTCKKSKYEFFCSSICFLLAI